ncbi:MAG: DNA polymerase domain-containing protein [Candidatus Aenigmarchaeota archaeon]|nr:DNA polymerase domain-containing protein [Candidatus Aenigmarchaeota archaeon]
MRQYKGGYVKEPITGIHKNIIVLDFRNLYPSIIVTHNIDPTTLNKQCKTKVMVPGFNRWFCQDKIAPIPKRIKKILEDRWEIKKKLEKKYDEKLAKKEKQLKLAANIAYGYFGYRNSPYYSVECAESISAFGRSYIQMVILKAQEEGFRVIYSDTDSVFLSGNQKKVMKFLKKVNNDLPGIIKLEYRGTYKKGLFVTTKTGRGAKKKYALMNGKGEMTIRGFETRREDWCSLAKNMQTEVLKFVLNNQKLKAVNYVKNTIKKVKQHKIKLTDLIITVQLTKPISEYKNIGAHVRVAKKIGNVKVGTTVKFIITKGKGSYSERAESFNKVKIKNIDEKYYIENQIIPSALRVLSVFNVKEKDLNE